MNKINKAQINSETIFSVENNYLLNLGSMKRGGGEMENYSNERKTRKNMNKRVTFSKTNQVFFIQVKLFCKIGFRI